MSFNFFYFLSYIIKEKVKRIILMKYFLLYYAMQYSYSKLFLLDILMMNM